MVAAGRRRIAFPGTDSHIGCMIKFSPSKRFVLTAGALLNRL